MNLPAVQQAAIRDAALAEFAAHGFRDASLNRIIQAAGISKGSMYYYFDDKEELYSHVMREQFDALIERSGPFPVPDEPHPEAFWTAIEGYYLRLMRSLTGSPALAALLRDWLAVPAAPALRAQQHDAEEALLPWLIQVIQAGQDVGAVRTDLPMELLLSLVTRMGQAMDTWLITQPPAPDHLPDAVHTLVGLLRRTLAP